MGKILQILSGIREFISIFHDIWDILIWLGIIGGGGGTVVGILEHIPIWAIVLLFGLCIASIVQAVIKYKRWQKIMGERKECLGIPSLLEQMYNHLCQMAKKLVDTGVVDDEKLSEAISQFVEALALDKRLGNRLQYQFGLGAMMDKRLGWRLWHKLLYKKSSKKDFGEARLLMTLAFNKAGIEIKKDDQYDLLKTQLDALTKTMSDDDINRDIEDYLNVAYQICTTQSGDKYWFGDIEGIGILVERYHSKIQKAMSQKLFRLKKKIIKYWLRAT